MVQDAWALLCRLPTNSTAFDSILTLDGALTTECDRRPRSPADGPVRWGSVCNGGAALKLLYALQIIDRIATDKDVSPLNATPIDVPDCWRARHRLQQRNKRWRKHFVELGGLRHVCRILNECDLRRLASSALTLQTLTRLLELLGTFLLRKAAATATDWTWTLVPSDKRAGVDMAAVARRALEAACVVVEPQVRGDGSDWTGGDAGDIAAAAAARGSNTPQEAQVVMHAMALAVTVCRADMTGRRMASIIYEQPTGSLQQSVVQAVLHSPHQVRCVRCPPGRKPTRASRRHPRVLPARL